MECTWTTRKIFANPRLTLESLQILYRGIHLRVTPKASGEAAALISAGRLVAREGERIGSIIAMPTLPRTPRTLSSFFLVDVPQSSTVG